MFLALHGLGWGVDLVLDGVDYAPINLMLKAIMFNCYILILE